jgi:hypothetical protein
MEPGPRMDRARGRNEFRLPGEAVAPMLRNSVGVKDDKRIGRQGGNEVARIVLILDSERQIRGDMLQERMRA